MRAPKGLRGRRRLLQRRGGISRNSYECRAGWSVRPRFTCGEPLDGVEQRVGERVRATNAWRAWFLGLAFALTFVVSMIGDALSMGSLRDHAFMVAQLVASLAVA